MNISIPLSGLQNAAFRQNVTANNVANLNTAGYRARSVVNSEVDGVGVRVGEIRESEVPGRPDVLNLSAEALASSNVSLVTEVAATMANGASYQANAAVVRAEDDLLGTLLDIRK